MSGRHPTCILQLPGQGALQLSGQCFLGDLGFRVLLPFLILAVSRDAAGGNCYNASLDVSVAESHWRQARHYKSVCTTHALNVLVVIIARELQDRCPEFLLRMGNGQADEIFQVTVPPEGPVFSGTGCPHRRKLCDSKTVVVGCSRKQQVQGQQQ